MCCIVLYRHVNTCHRPDYCDSNVTDNFANSSRNSSHVWLNLWTVRPFRIVYTAASRGITPVVTYWVSSYATMKSPSKSLLPVKLNNLLQNTHITGNKYSVWNLWMKWTPGNSITSLKYYPPRMIDSSFSWVDLPWSPNADSHWSLTGRISPSHCSSAVTWKYTNGTAQDLKCEWTINLQPLLSSKS